MSWLPAPARGRDIQDSAPPPSLGKYTSHRAPAETAAAFGQSPARIDPSSGSSMSPYCLINRATCSRPRRSHREHATSSIAILSAKSPSVTEPRLITLLHGSGRNPVELVLLRHRNR